MPLPKRQITWKSWDREAIYSELRNIHINVVIIDFILNNFDTRTIKKGLLKLVNGTEKSSHPLYVITSETVKSFIRSNTKDIVEELKP